MGVEQRRDGGASRDQRRVQIGRDWVREAIGVHGTPGLWGPRVVELPVVLERSHRPERRRNREAGSRRHACAREYV